MKRMLFNATQEEELRVAIVDGQKLIDLDIEHAGKEQRKSNIYKGVITRIEPSLEACFVNYGTDRHGFLPFKEVARSYFQDGADGRASIKEALREGQELIVQVDKDERGNKGAALTTFISLAGRYLVLMPNNPRGGGVSRRIEGEDRNELRDLIAQLEVPSGMSVIARTAGIGRNLEELQWDLNYLLQLWTAVESASTIQKGAFLIYQEGSLVIRAIRDYFQPDIGEILIDTPEIHEQALQFMNHVMPANVSRVKLYRDEIPLFSRFQIEHQIETAFAREVRLPSGGAIVIDHTEALVSIDVNSGRSTRGSDIEETAFKTNLEAADEAARQLRLRDLGGLVVIDFIDMESQRNQREVENRLRDALHYDRARVQTGKISRFGLLELSRQRLRPSLGETNHIPCPRCHGTGHIRGIESTALHILRITQEEAMKENSAVIQVQLPVEAATFLLNEKRSEIHSIEQRMGVKVVLIPNIHLETPNYKIVRLRHDDVSDESKASYELVELISEIEEAGAVAQKPEQVRLEAAVKGITPSAPAPIHREPEPVAAPKASLFGRFRTWLSAISAKPEEAAVTPEPRKREGARRNERNRNERTDRNRGERAERGDRGNRPEQQRNRSAEQRQTEGRPERAERPARPQQEAKPAAPKPEKVERERAPQAPVAEGVESGEQPQRSSRRRGRGGRDRQRDGAPREARERKPLEVSAEVPALEEAISDAPILVVDTPAIQTEMELTSVQAKVESAAEVKAEAIAEAPVAETVNEAPEAAEAAPAPAKPERKPRAPRRRKTEETAVSEESAPAAAEAPIAPAAVAETPVVEVKEAAAPVAAKAKPARAAAPAPIVVADIATSGLEMVETKATAAPVVAAEEPEAPKRKSGPAPWQKKAEAQAAEEPLVMIETQK
ncbi:MAG TPA: Rne/Rng family ribonuclease [Methylophilaceae bacterium]|nr:Rne/Rng family ribonuclease [Methylophilaceae bacterium]